MLTIKLFHRDEIESVIRLDPTIIDVIDDAFTALATKDTQMPPIMRVDIPEHNGEVDIKSAYIEGYDSFAIKLSSGFFNNPDIGLPSANGMMILMNSETGEPKAVLADQGLLTDLRTAAAGAVAAKHLSKEESRTAGVIGTGSQARYQLQALTHVRSIEKAFVYGRRKQKAEEYKSDLEQSLGIPIEVCETPQQVVENSEIVVTTTPATEPIIKAEWIHPGLHITAMGSDAEHKQEIDTAILDLSDLVVCDVKEQSLRLGELRTCANKETIDQVRDLGEITSGQKPGRMTNEEVTICDLTGTGVQDTAIARHVYQILVSEEEYNEEG